MKLKRIVLGALIVVAGGFASCAGDGSSDPDKIKPMDSPALDSTMPAHVQDPSTAYPQPPVTGTQTDSSRTTDSVKRKGDTSVKKQ